MIRCQLGVRFQLHATRLRNERGETIENAHALVKNFYGFVGRLSAALASELQQMAGSMKIVLHGSLKYTRTFYCHATA